MIIDFQKQIEEAQRIRSLVKTLVNLIKEKADIEKITEKGNEIRGLSDQLIFAPKSLISDFDRHLHFVFYYADLEDYEWMESNATDLVNDITQIEETFRKFTTFSYFDDEIISKCADLITSGRFDDAVRNAFIVVEEKMRRKLGRRGIKHSSRDTPKDLIDKLFPREGSELEASYFLFRGAFQLFRGEIAHRFMDLTYPQALALINLAQIMLDVLERRT